MAKVQFGEIIKEVKENIDRSTDKHEYFIAGDHMDSENIHLTRRGRFEGSDVGPAFIRLFRPGQILYGSRRTYLKKVAVADFEGITSNTTFVLESKNEGVFRQDLLPFIMLSDSFTDYSIKKSKGSTNPYILFSDLIKYELELPSIDKQEELSDVLWSIEETCKAYKNLLAETDELVKTQFVEMFGDPIQNDRNWDTQPLKKVAPEASPALPQEDMYWWLNLDMIESYSGNLIERVMAPAKEIGNSTSPFDNTMVLYSKLRPYLNKVFVPDGYGYATTELVKLKPDTSKLNKLFLFNLLRGNEFVNYANTISGGAQMPRMPMNELRNFPCILPPMELQEKFVELANQSDKSKFALQQSLKEARALQKKIVEENFIPGKER